MKESESAFCHNMTFNTQLMKHYIASTLEPSGLNTDGTLYVSEEDKNDKEATADSVQQRRQYRRQNRQSSSGNKTFFFLLCR